MSEIVWEFAQEYGIGILVWGAIIGGITYSYVHDDDTSQPPAINLDSSRGKLPSHTGDLDCDDFSTQSEAQRHFNSQRGDPDRLDRDNDGVPCETLP
jgi:hypothetical protein